MIAQELINILMLNPEREVIISVDVSTSEHDAFSRVYGEIVAWQDDAVGDGIVLLADGHLNSE